MENFDAAVKVIVYIILKEAIENMGMSFQFTCGNSLFNEPVVINILKAYQSSKTFNDYYINTLSSYN